jgi:hypothetical protein
VKDDVICAYLAYNIAAIKKQFVSIASLRISLMNSTQRTGKAILSLGSSVVGHISSQASSSKILLHSSIRACLEKEPILPNLHTVNLMQW